MNYGLQDKKLLLSAEALPNGLATARLAANDGARFFS